MYNYAKMLINVQERMHMLEWEKQKIIEEAWPEYVSLVHRIPIMWECPDSPFGYCAYDAFEDPAWDGCVFCGEPHERK